MVKQRVAMSRSHNQRSDTGMEAAESQVTTGSSDTEYIGGNVASGSRLPAVERNYSNRSADSNSASAPSTASTRMSVKRKRELEMDAARKRFAVQSRMLEERAKLEIEVINAELAMKLAENEDARTEDDRRSVVSKDDMVTEWVRRSRTDTASLEPIIETMGRENPQQNIADGLRDLTRELTRTIKDARADPAYERMSQGIIKRMSLKGTLPTFDGDVLEWPGFKRAFEESSSRMGYNEQENMVRLNESLKGAAREAVASLMLTSDDTKRIMEILQLRFGNPSAIADRIVRNLKRLPTIRSVGKDLITFATIVKNCVAALEAANHIGYLHSPELIKEITNKMSSTLVLNYTRYANERNAHNQPALITLSNFLFFEAELACKAGIVESTSSADRHSKHEHKSEKDSHHRSSHKDQQRSSERVYVTRDRREGKDAKGETKCGYCKSTSHLVTGCEKFKRLSSPERWNWASGNRVCFRCLVKTDHRQNRCREASCKVAECRGMHHYLLHRTRGQEPVEKVEQLREKALDTTSRTQKER